jgi:hypothetical protein
MTARTIVGSGPRRRPLPLGREAVERAIRHCEWSSGHDTAMSSGRLYGARLDALRENNGGTLRASPPCQWLPFQLRYENVEQLRERLRGYP